MEEFQQDDTVQIADDSETGEDGLFKGTVGNVKLVETNEAGVTYYLVDFGHCEAWLNEWELARY